jgi:hypothetical protein
MLETRGSPPDAAMACQVSEAEVNKAQDASGSRGDAWLEAVGECRQIMAEGDPKRPGHKVMSWSVVPAGKHETSCRQRECECRHLLRRIVLAQDLENGVVSWAHGMVRGLLMSGNSIQVGRSVEC